MKLSSSPEIFFFCFTAGQWGFCIIICIHCTFWISSTLVLVHRWRSVDPLDSEFWPGLHRWFSACCSACCLLPLPGQFGWVPFILCGTSSVRENEVRRACYEAKKTLCVWFVWVSTIQKKHVRDKRGLIHVALCSLIDLQPLQEDVHQTCQPGADSSQQHHCVPGLKYTWSQPRCTGKY